jgi:hypothetical protein
MQIEALKTEIDFLTRKLNDEIKIREDIIHQERRVQDTIIEDNVKARERILKS